MGFCTLTPGEVKTLNELMSQSENKIEFEGLGEIDKHGKETVFNGGLVSLDEDLVNEAQLEFTILAFLEPFAEFLTYHNIFSVANCLTQLGYKILNVITWAKTNPPPNISCRYFTYSTEFIIWARKKEKVAHYYNYELMKRINDDKQMTDVWRLPAIAPWEKTCSKHPTQKPLGLLSRIIMASTKPGAWIMDPFAGSSTTGIAVNLLGRRYLGIEREEEFANISRARREEIENGTVFATYKKKISDIVKAEDKQINIFSVEDPMEVYCLPFLDERRLPLSL